MDEFKPGPIQRLKNEANFSYDAHRAAIDAVTEMRSANMIELLFADNAKARINERVDEMQARHLDRDFVRDLIRRAFREEAGLHFFRQEDAEKKDRIINEFELKLFSKINADIRPKAVTEARQIALDLRGKRSIPARLAHLAIAQIEIAVDELKDEKLSSSTVKEILLTAFRKAVGIFDEVAEGEKRHLLETIEQEFHTRMKDL